MLTDQRRKAKEQRDRERLRQRQQDVFRRMQELLGEAELSQQPIHQTVQQAVQQAIETQPEPSPTPQPVVSEPPEPTVQEPPKPPPKPVQPDPVTAEFLRWCFRKRYEDEEYEEPSRYKRFPQIYRRRDGGN